MATDDLPPTPVCHENIHKRPRKRSRLYRVMARHPELLCLLIVLVLSVLSKYTKSYQPVLLSQPPPVRYFPASSPVVDLVYGNLLDAADLLYQDEILFVMYYAPWCAKSSRVRWEFDKAARYLENEVTFVGINCWYTDGSCRQQNNFSGFPVLFAYLAHFDGYRYDGIMTAEYMVKFLEQLKYPLTHLHNAADVTSFMNNHDNAVIGFFDFHASPQPPGLQQYYCSALRTLQSDPKNMVEFGLISSKNVADKFNIRRSRTVVISRTNNETLKYPIFNNLTSSELTKWIMASRQQPAVKWLLPSGTKTLSLSSEINKGPAIIIFTQHRPVDRINFKYNLLREVAVDYHNCENKSLAAHHASHGYHRWKSMSSALQLSRECVSLKQDSQSKSTTLHEGQMWISSCMSFLDIPQEPTKLCELCFHCHRGNKQHAELINPREPTRLSHSVFRSYFHQYFNRQSDLFGCQVAKLTYNPDDFMSLCCNQGYKTIDSLILVKRLQKKPSGRWFTDPFVKNSVKKGINHKCQKLRFRRVNSWTAASQSVHQLKWQEGYTSAISGLDCRTNKSVNFYAMNIVQSHQFLERLGVPIVHRENQSTVVLIDNKEKAQYVMKTDFSQQNVVNFIQNYTDGSLRRSLRSEHHEAQGDESLIHEVTSDTFHTIVMDNTKDVVLLYYAPWCGFCIGFAHLYIALARYFKDSKSIVFARINAETNDMLWEYKVEKYPSIILFPAGRKSESEAFPSEEAKTLPNLVKFVSQYANKKVKIESGLRKCSQTCIQNNIHKLSYRMQVLTSELWILERRIAQVENQMVSLKSSSAELEDDETIADDGDTESRHTSARIKNCELYVHLLRMECSKKQLQLQNTKILIGVLKRTNGLSLERHKMEDIMKKHTLYTEQLLQLSKQKNLHSYQDKEKNDISVEHTSLNSHDEL